MLTRRFALLGATLLAGAPAIARAKRGKAARVAEAEASGGAAATPLGPVDTAARWAFA
ncbi:MAG: D-alanyl-D-alanine carboxypeptidase, partial [Acetobacteraceae bacterium]|nr:D-alanyl-D-alanine carboxypeptidase [Acetobacteraceae bacterium]